MNKTQTLLYLSSVLDFFTSSMWEREEEEENGIKGFREIFSHFILESPSSTFHLILSCSIAKIEIPYHIYTQLTTCWWCHSSLLTRAILNRWFFHSPSVSDESFLLSFHFFPSSSTKILFILMLLQSNVHCTFLRCDACRSLSHKKFNTRWKKMYILSHFLQV
jgi:hypothetical protein